MVLISTRLLFFLTFCSFTTYGRLLEGGKNVCKRYYYKQEKYKVDCGFWNWQACSRYRSVKVYSLECCRGYSSNDYEKRECTYAICADRINPEGACNINYKNDSIVYRGNRVVTNSGGMCVTPETCEKCNNGFYADGPKCRICPYIPNCLHRQCTSQRSYWCEYCDGEYKPLNKYLFWNAYIRGINDNHGECKKACSWRKDSTRCFPGNCTYHGTASSCKCIDGFGGYQCDEIIKDVSIVYTLAKLKGSGDPVESPANSSEPLKSDTKWTNQRIIEKANLTVTGIFKSTDNFPKPDKEGQNHFVTEFEYGITRGEVRLSFVRDKSFTLNPIVIMCIPMRPTTVQYTCAREVSLKNDPEWNKLSHFAHNDRQVNASSSE